MSIAMIDFAQCSIVVPVYNEVCSIRHIVEEIFSTCPNAEIIVVDDGSADGTTGELTGLPVRVIRHDSNRGYGAALKSGILACTKDIIVTIDADAEHSPRDIQKLIAALPGVVIAIGARVGPVRGSLGHKIGRELLYRLACFCASADIPDINSGLRAFHKRDILPHLNFFPNTFSFSTTSTLALLFSGGKIKYVDVSVSPRVGISKVVFRDGIVSVYFILRLMAYRKPLRMLALVTISLTVIYAGYLLVLGPRTLVLDVMAIGLLMSTVIQDKITRDNGLASMIVKEVCE